MSASIQIIGLDKLQAGVAAAPATLAREVRTAIVAGSKLVEATQRGLAPKFSGALVQSIATTISGGGASITANIGPRARYAIFVERGRGPGRPPPVGAVEAWARAKGLSPYAVAASIGRKGTRPHPFVQPSLSPNVGKIEALFKNVCSSVVVRMAG